MNPVRIFLAVIFAISTTASAQLKWTKRTLEFHPAVTDTKVVAEFPFINIGTRAVKIDEVKTSCGCTTATLDKQVYAPGEKGKITAVFDIGSRTGIQQKHVYVSSNDPKEPQVMLTFTATIPKLLDVDPIFLNWVRGEELKPKTVTIKVMGNYPVEHLKITSTDPRMTTEVKHEAGSRLFQVICTPRPAGQGLSAGIEISPDYPKDPPKYYHVYTRVDG